MSSYKTILTIMSGGVAGVVYEIIPKIEEKYTEEEKTIIANNIMDLAGDHWLIPQCGSVIWVIYKRLFGQNIEEFVDGINTLEKQEECRKLVREKYNM